MNILQEAKKFNLNSREQKNIKNEHFILWEYKMFRMGSNKISDLIDIILSTDVKIYSKEEVNKDNFMSALQKYKNMNKKLFLFIKRYK